MFVSSIGSASAQQVLQPLLTSAESAAEGNTPDGDRDRDDVSNISATTDVNNSANVTESIGQNINVYA
jgi:hypothetical protein